jgi:AcrR family transcriptional regulator
VGSIYRYFPGKEGVANALYRREKEALAAVVFAQTWTGIGRFAITHTAGLCFLELHHHGAYLDDDSRNIAATIDQMLADLLRTWQADGAVRSGDAALLLAQVFGSLVGSLRHLRATNQPITERLSTDTVAPAWALLARKAAGS